MTQPSLILKLFTQLYVRGRFLITHRKHLHEHIILLRGGIWVHKTYLTQTLFIEVPTNLVGNFYAC
jgi:hypothetical protein